MINLLEMRNDYDVICEKVSVLRDLETRAERRAAAVEIIEEHNLQLFARQLVDLIGKEFI